MRMAPIACLLGMLVACLGLAFLPVALFSLASAEYSTAGAFVAAALAALLAGGVLFFLFRQEQAIPTLTTREGMAVVGFCWLAAGVVAALPYIFTGVLTPVRAFFESCSGLTTTGATLFVDIEALPKGILLWRSLTHWLGGMGIIVLFLAVLPFLGLGGMQLYKAEVTGTSKVKLAPRLRDTARFLWGVYVLLTLILTLLLWFQGMTLFDAINHAMSTLATGGFSTKNASIAAYPSPWIQWTITLFMFLAGANFTLHFQALRGRFSVYRGNTEFMAYAAYLLVGGLAITALLAFASPEQGSVPGLENNARNAFFQVVSIASTTGFVTANYGLWPMLTQGILLVFMIICACSGSTGGGVKMVRVVLLFRMLSLEIRRVIHPRSVERIKLDGRHIAPETITNVMVFCSLYALLTLGGALILMIADMDFATAFSAVITSLSNVGPGFGAVGPVDTFGFMPDSMLAMLALFMVMGRLEIFTILILFSPAFWRR